MTAAVVGKRPVRKLSPAAVRRLQIAAVVLVLLGVVLGTKAVPIDDPLAQGREQFDPDSFGVDHFPEIQEAIRGQAVDAAILAEEIEADAAAAAERYAVQSSGGPVYSVILTGQVGEGQSGIYQISVDEVSADLLIRVQTGPAINGTELRDATGEITFGQFRNQIDYQDAASALNEQMKLEVLDGIDTAALPGRTITVTGVFTLVNPAAWLITPSEIEVQ